MPHRDIIRPNRHKPDRDPPEGEILTAFAELNKAWETYKKSIATAEEEYAVAQLGKSFLWLSDYKIYASYHEDRPHLEWWSRDP
jgi:hypothetical protein